MSDHPCFKCEKRHPKCHSDCKDYMMRDPADNPDNDYIAYCSARRAKHNRLVLAKRSRGKNKDG